jgi:phospholipid/cholesterol/gamma-HCH transport system ATP-binding protein
MDPLVCIRKLRTMFGQRVVHDDIDFSLYKNELVVLAGGSGSGKTSIINFMTGESANSTGEIIFNNASISKNTFARHVSLAPQHGGLLSDYNTLDNIILAIQAAFGFADDIAREIAVLYGQSVNLDMDALHKYPADLSGGMLRRAVLARAIASEPDLLILDEPLAGLDHANVMYVSNLIRHLPYATLCVTHLPIKADRYLFLYEGSIYEADMLVSRDTIDYSTYPEPVMDMVKYFVG